jgi:hypothetical protein
LRRVRETIVAVEKQEVLRILSVFVAVGIQYAMRTRHISSVACPALQYRHHHQQLTRSSGLTRLEVSLTVSLGFFVFSAICYGALRLHVETNFCVPVFCKHWGYI